MTGENYLDRSPELDIEYGRTLIQLAGERARGVQLRVTGIVGLAVLFLTQLPFLRLTAMPSWSRWVFVVGLASAVGSAAFYFRYLTKLDLVRLDMALYVRDGKGRAVGEIWSGGGTFWLENRWLFRCGSTAAVASIVMLGVTLLQLLGLLS